MNFDELLESKGYMDGCGTDYQDAYDKGFDEGAKSQQAKIDILQIKLNGADERAAAVLNHKNKMIDELQARVGVYDEHVKTLKNIHENDFNEESESSYILGNLDGFFECIESDLKVVRDD